MIFGIAILYFHYVIREIQQIFNSLKKIVLEGITQLLK